MMTISTALPLLTLALLPAIVIDGLVGSGRRPAVRITLAAAVVALMLLPFSGLSLARRLLGVTGAPAVLSSALVLWYWLRAFGADPRRSTDRQLAALAAAIAVFALFFYPLSLGATFVDPYSHGYYPTVLSALLLAIVIAAALAGWWLWAALLAIAYAGYAAGLLESDNLWDYLIDPLLAVAALALAIAWRGHLAALRWRDLFPRRFTIGALVLVGVFLGYALLLSRINPDVFDNAFTVEDGFVEWMTSIALFIACVYGLWRFHRARHRFGVRGQAILLFVALVGLFGAGEEISWGQRLFDIETPQAWKAHNAQEETNLHNLTFEWRGQTVKINRLVFGRGLALALLTYLLVMGPLYRRRPGFRRFIDGWGIPIATTTQTVAYLVTVAFVELLIDSPKRGEMTEFAGAIVFMLNVMFPFNREIFGETYGRNPA